MNKHFKNIESKADTNQCYFSSLVHTVQSHRSLMRFLLFSSASHRLRHQTHQILVLEGKPIEEK